VLPYPNSDGFEFTRDPSYAWVVALAPLQPGDDYDLEVYDDFVGSTVGFSNLVGSSAHGGNAIDFVVGHYDLTPATVFPAAVRFSVLGGGGDFAQDQTDARFRNGISSASWPDQLMGANRVADVYEVLLDPGQTIRVALRRLSGASDLRFHVYPDVSGGIYGRDGFEAASVSIDADHDVLDFTADSPGWHPIVVFRDVGTGADENVVYSLSWGDPVAVGAPGPLAAAAARFAFDGARPNPARGPTSLHFELPAAAATRLAVYDVAGRRVRQLLDGIAESGVRRVVWDGRADDGSQVAAGVYYVRLESLGRHLTRSVTVLR
jgi:hypothetical protein